MRLAVLLPTFRQPDLLMLTLRDLSDQDYSAEGWSLVVIDDGSKDSTNVIATTCAPTSVESIICRRVTSGTYSHAMLFNEMLRLAPADCDVFVHVEDVRLRPDFLRQHAKWHTGGRHNLVTGPMCEAPDETFNPEACSRWSLMKDAAAESGACRCCFQAIFAKSMSYSRDLVSSLTPSGGNGPFDEAMVGWGYHETEFAFRASHAGWTCVYDRACAVFHPPHGARDERYRGIDRDALRTEGTDRNLAYLCDKHEIAEMPGWQHGKPL